MHTCSSLLSRLLRPAYRPARSLTATMCSCAAVILSPKTRAATTPTGGCVQARIVLVAQRSSPSQPSRLSLAPPQRLTFGSKAITRPCTVSTSLTSGPFFMAQCTRAQPPCLRFWISAFIPENTAGVAACTAAMCQREGQSWCCCLCQPWHILGDDPRSCEHRL